MSVYHINGSQRTLEQQSVKKHEEATKLLQQRDSQITALSDNLVLVRTELEKSSRRNEELEDLAKSLNQQIEGKKIIQHSIPMHHYRINLSVFKGLI